MTWAFGTLMGLSLLASFAVRATRTPSQALALRGLYWLLLGVALLTVVGGDSDWSAWVLRGLGGTAPALVDS